MFRRRKSGNFFFLQGEINSKENVIIVKNIKFGNCYKFQSVNFKVIHSQFIGQPIMARLNAFPWL
jgi:hypothetical protein